MKIDHLIDGKAVASSDCFESTNPATQGVLAEVATGCPLLLAELTARGFRTKKSGG